MMKATTDFWVFYPYPNTYYIVHGNFLEANNLVLSIKKTNIMFLDITYHPVFI
jgi:hypothetical protein